MNSMPYQETKAALKYPVILGLLGALCCSVSGCSSYQQQFRVTVEAGASHRIATPVFIDVGLPAVDAGMAAVAQADGEQYPAQIENLGNAMARIWWIIDDLPAGTSRDYLLKIGARVDAPGFQWLDTPGQHTELRLDDTAQLRYVYAAYAPDNLDETRNPYHHVFSPDGTEMITKGAGGKYPHHRGIFFGYTKVIVGDSTYNIWAAQRGEHASHMELLRDEAGQVFGGHRVAISWYDRHDNAMLTETRSVRAFTQPDGNILLDWQTELKTSDALIRLTGDRQHAGAHFRARNEVAEQPEGTTFLRPQQWADLPGDEEINDAGHRDLPWNAMQFNLGSNAYTVAYLSDPGNPSGADFSERSYGRFGEFFPWDLSPANPLRAHYRFWVTAGRDTERAAVERRYRDLADPPVVKLVSE
jgi:hypothetical protein